MRLTRRQRQRTRENIIPLINVVFLMLVFFLLAGTLVTDRQAEILLPRTELAETAAPPSDALYLTHDGEFRWQGRAGDLDALAGAIVADGEGRLRIVADHRLAATALVDALHRLRGYGLDDAVIITRRGGGRS